jgi:16S rRNA (guanine966-N2)-methyltransferase
MIKITGGDLRGRSLRWQSRDDLRPTSAKVREAIFNVMRDYVADSTWLDLCAGTGIMGVEALSRGAAHVHFVERHGRSLGQLRENLKTLSLTEQATLYSRDVVSFLHQWKQPVDVIFCDPPYDSRVYKPIFELLDAGMPLWGTGQTQILIEHRKNRELTDFPFQHLQIHQVRPYGDTTLTWLVQKSHG